MFFVILFFIYLFIFTGILFPCRVSAGTTFSDGPAYFFLFNFIHSKSVTVKLQQSSLSVSVQVHQ